MRSLEVAFCASVGTQLDPKLLRGADTGLRKQLFQSNATRLDTLLGVQIGNSFVERLNDL